MAIGAPTHPLLCPGCCGGGFFAVEVVVVVVSTTDYASEAYQDSSLTDHRANWNSIWWTALRPSCSPIDRSAHSTLADKYCEQIQTCAQGQTLSLTHIYLYSGVSAAATVLDARNRMPGWQTSNVYLYIKYQNIRCIRKYKFQ